MGLKAPEDTTSSESCASYVRMETLPYPQWLNIVAWLYLAICFACAAFIVVDEFRRPQKMMVMNFVWPITALYFGPLALWGYFRSGPKMTGQHMAEMKKQVETELQTERKSSSAGSMPEPTPEQTAVADSHCGAGCALGDIAAEWWVFGAGLVLVGGEFGTRILLDFVLAWCLGIVFQYFTIAPMRGLSFGKGLVAAMRADTLSITSFQVGMFVWMALTYYVFFPDPHLKPTGPVFWFMMQIGMVLGFLTSYPVNRFLIQKGWKERMPQYKHEMKIKMQEEKQQELSPEAEAA